MGCESDRSDSDLPLEAAQPVVKRHVCHHEGCGAAFTRPGRLHAHLQLHEGKVLPASLPLEAAQPVVKRHVCHHEGCGAAFTRPYRLRAHLQLHGGKVLPASLPLEATQPVVKRHVCHHEGCGAAFTRPYRLRAHLQLHEGKKWFKCDVDGCEKSYTNNAHLKRHITTTHEKHGYVPVFICQEPGCLRHLSNEANLRRHHQQVHNKPYVCETCGACFNKHNKLAAHVATHTGVFAFKCDVCDVCCATSYDLKRHARGHKTYACSHPGCESCYDTWSQLRKHFKLEHPHQYKCSDCSKVFTSKPQLRTHIAVHLHPLEREVLHCPYDKCPRFYFHKKNLTHHVKSSHEGKRFPCDQLGCDRTFCTKRKMEDHKKLHDPGARLPRRHYKSRRKRKDIGKPKRCIAAKLSGASVPYHIEKHLLEHSGVLEELLAAEGTSNSLGIEMCTSVVNYVPRPDDEGSDHKSTLDVHEARCRHQQAEDVARAEGVCDGAGPSITPGSEPCSLPSVVTDVCNMRNIDSSLPGASMDALEDCGGQTTVISEQVHEEDSNLQKLLQCARSLANNTTCITSDHESSDREINWRQRSSVEDVEEQFGSRCQSECRKNEPVIVEDDTRVAFNYRRTKVGSTTDRQGHSAHSAVMYVQPDTSHSGVVSRSKSVEAGDSACMSDAETFMRGSEGQEMTDKLACSGAGVLSAPYLDSKLSGQRGLLGGARCKSVPAECCTKYSSCVGPSKTRSYRTSSHEEKLLLPRLFSIVNTRQWLSAMLLAMRLAVPEIEDPVLHQT